MIKTISKKDIQSRFSPYYVVDRVILKVSLSIGESYNVNDPKKYIDSALSNIINESFDISKKDSGEHFYFHTINDAKQFMYDEVAHFIKKKLEFVGVDHKNKDFFQDALHYLESSVTLDHPSFKIEHVPDEVEFDLEKVTFYDENRQFYYVFTNRCGAIEVTPVYFRLCGFFIVNSLLSKMHETGVLLSSVNSPLYEMVTKDGTSIMINIPRDLHIDTSKPFRFHTMSFRDMIYPNAEDVISLLEEKKSSLYSSLKEYDDMKNMILSSI